jgi:catechol 2,3-dioxygenase-like lactoylglutathione lyase family enzyme
MTIAIDRLDHLVLTVRDMDVTCSFYSRVLGMERRTFGDSRTALYFGRQKLNLHDAAKPVDPNVRHAAPGSSDLCFITETPMDDVIAHLAAEGVSIITGPGERSGATGTLLSVYVYDPDENLIEIANLLP